MITGQIFFKECPSLYEIENCFPLECEDDTPFIDQLDLISKTKKKNLKHHFNNNKKKNINDSIHFENLKKNELEKKNRIKISGTNIFLAPANIAKKKCN